MKRRFFLSLCAVLFFYGVASADYVWDGGTGTITDANWNSGQASPFTTTDGIDTTNANQSIYITSGSVTSNGFLLKTSGSGLGSEEPYIGRTVLRLTGGSLNTGSKNVTVEAGSGFIQTGGTLTINAPTMTLKGSKVPNVFGAGTSSDRDSITIGTLTSSGDSHVTFGGYSDVSITNLNYDLEKGGSSPYDITFTGKATVTLCKNGSSDPIIKAFGSLTVSGATVEIWRTLNVDGTGTISSGSVTMKNASSGNLNVANNSTTGNLTLSNGSVTANNVRVGNNPNTSGILTIEGGEMTQTVATTEDSQGFIVGNNGTAKLNMKGGTLDVKGNFIVSNKKAGSSVNQSGGTIKAAQKLLLGQNSYKATYTLSAGTLEFGADATAFTIGAGSCFTQTGGLVNTLGSNVELTVNNSSQTDSVLGDGEMTFKKVTLYDSFKFNATDSSKSSVNLSTVAFSAGSNLEIGGETRVTWTIPENSNTYKIPANTNLLVSGNAKLTLSATKDPELVSDVAGFEIAGGTVEVNRTFNLSAPLTVSGGTLTMTNTSSGNINVSNTSQTGELTIRSGSVTANNIRVGNVNGAKGEMTISGGTVNQTATSTALERRKDAVGFYVGNNANTVGKLTMTGGSLSAADDFYVGNYGTGTVTQSSGIVTASKNLLVGKDGTGSWAISGDAKVNVTGNLGFADGWTTGNATFTQSGGTVTVGGQLNVGTVGTANFLISNGTTKVAELISIGSGSKATTFTMTGGSLVSTKATSQDALNIGNNNTVETVAEISGGSVSLLGQTYIGRNNGKGKLLLSGTGSFKTQNSIYLGGGNASATGTVQMTGGNWESGNNTVVGENGTGTFTQTGGTLKTGTVSAEFRDFLVARREGSTGTYTISGGSLDTTSKGGGIYLGMTKDGAAGGAGTMIVNGGTVKAASFKMTEKCSLVFNVDGENFGTMAITGTMTLAGSKNAINISARSMFQTDVTSANLLTVGSGDLSSLQINDGGSAWNVTKNGSGVQISLKNLQAAAYTVDSGARSMNNLAAGALQIIPNNDRYDLYLTVNNLTNETGEEFASWLAENSDYSTSYLGDGVVQVGIFEDVTKYFAWDFTGFTPVSNLALSSLEGAMHVPEPATWALLLLGAVGIVGLRRKK